MQSKVKILIMIFIIMFVIILLQNNVFASTVASGNCGPDGSDTVKWSLDSNGTLTISGSGNMGNGVGIKNGSITSYHSYWEDYQNQVKKVVFSGNITSIGSFAFQNNTSLTSIVIPDTVTSIRTRAFAECSNLKSVTLSKNLGRIYDEAFYACKSLEEIEIPESTMYMYEYAFYECTALKQVTIKSDIMYITSKDNVIPENAKIKAYKYSYPYYYARNFGRAFVDIKTGEESKIKVVNSDYLKILPTENVKNYGIVSTSTYAISTNGEVPALRTTTGYETDKNNVTYKEIKAKVDELTANCTTDREKAYAIYNWVVSNFKYQYGAGASATTKNVYYYWGTMIGNCEAYTMLTNFMLSLCDIPTGYVRGLNHAWSIAFVDGKWIYIDSTHYKFDGTDTHVNDILFAYDGVVYQILEPSEGAYIAGIAKLDSEIEKITSFTFPNNSFAKGVCISNFSKINELKGTAGTAIGNAIKNNRRYTATRGSIIVGRNDKAPDLGLPFVDVSSSDWSYNAIVYCYDNRIIYGTDETTYTPNKEITRAELVTIIYRMEGSPKVTGTNKFTDVKNGAWYTNAIIWASQKGVINGYTATTFGPNDNIKREDLAVILCNYTKKVKKLDVNVASNVLSNYPDKGEVNGYAESSVKWAVSKGVISGVKVSNTRYLQPESTATRAEATGMIYNFCTKIGK